MGSRHTMQQYGATPTMATCQYTSVWSRVIIRSTLQPKTGSTRSPQGASCERCRRAEGWRSAGESHGACRAAAFTGTSPISPRSASLILAHWRRFRPSGSLPISRWPQSTKIRCCSCCDALLQPLDSGQSGAKLGDFRCRGTNCRASPSDRRRMDYIEGRLEASGLAGDAAQARAQILLGRLSAVHCPASRCRRRNRRPCPTSSCG